MPKRSGRKSLSQTKAPKSDRIYGSKVNPKGSASSEKSASAIKLDAKTIASLSEKLKEFKSKHPSKDNVTLNDLKAVYRRGLGAYSSTHRPTISGGKPNTRNAWAMARVNKFLLKASGKPVKKAYVQDDDLLKYADGGGINDCFEFIQENESILNNGYYLDLNQLSNIIDPYSQIPMGLDFTLITYNSGGQNNLDVINTITPIECVNALYDFLNIDKSHLYALVNYYIDNAKRITDINQIQTKNVVIIDRDRIVCENLHQYDGGGNIDKLIEDGVVELNMYSTTNDHSKEYGFDAQKPLYIQSIIVSEQHRGKGIGTDVMKYIVDYATTNGHDVIFGHITQKAEPSIDVIKSMLMKSGFKTIEGNNDFYKVMNEYANGGEITNACIEEVVNIINSIQKVKDFYIYDGKLIIVLEDELMVYSVEMMNYHLQQFTECHDIIEPEVNLNYGENYKSIFLNLKVNNAMIGQFKYGGETDKYEISDYWDTETFGGGGEVKTKKIITDKIGWSEEVADYLIEVAPKLSVWIADSLKKEYLEDDSDKETKMLRKGLLKEMTKSTFRSVHGSDIRLILDWLQHPITPKQNLRELGWLEAIEKSKQWHDELTTLGGDIDFIEPEENEIFIDYPTDKDGATFYWVKIPSNFCSLESSRMGHCGRTGYGNTLISLRSVRPFGKGHTINDSHVTIAYNEKDGLFYQTKGKKNQKPSEKYFPYIFDLIKTLAKQDRYLKINSIDEDIDKSWAERNSIIELNETLRQDIDDLNREATRLDALLMKVKNNYDYQEIMQRMNDINKEVKTIYEKMSENRLLIQGLDNYIDLKQGVIDDIRKMSQFGFNGFASEYATSEDYGFEDMTKEQVEELFAINPKIFSGLGGELILYNLGVSDNKPNTKFTLSRDIEYLDDVIPLSRDVSINFIKQILNSDFDGYISHSERDIIANYLDDLDAKSVEIIEEKISEITGMPKEEVHEDGIEYYLNGDYNYEHDKDFDFDEIFNRINRAINQAENDDTSNHYYKELKSELEKVGKVIELTDADVTWEVDFLDHASIGALSRMTKQYEIDSLPSLFMEAISYGDIEIERLDLDYRYDAYADPKYINERFQDDDFYEDGGEVGDNNETYKKWKSLVNMSSSELKRFYDSQEGKDAGLSSSEAKAQGIDSGRESARWILKMKATPKSEWTPQMWKWAKKQISFISRMSGNKGSLYDDKGRKTRKHTSLLIWGHNPEKKKGGGEIPNDLQDLLDEYRFKFIMIDKDGNYHWKKSLNYGNTYIHINFKDKTYSIDNKEFTNYSLSALKKLFKTERLKQKSLS